MRPEFDVIGYWTEVKLQIIQEYAKAYSRILAAKGFYHVYIDAFAGAGKHISKSTMNFIPGSPQIALDVDPPFREYHFIDINSAKITELSKAVSQRPEAHIYEGDCNQILLTEIFPKVKYSDYRRGLCLLDPYGLHLNWQVMQTAGQMKSIDMFLNFPILDINRNVLWHKIEDVDPRDISRMNAYWGDESWRASAYSRDHNLFGWEMKEGNEAVTMAFRKRLHEVAGFQYVSQPLPMRNSKGNIVYYLFFASQQPAAIKIIRDIFTKYRRLGTR
jgi:three-Cys-motif partner protein